MIRTARQSPLDLLSAWVSGVSVLFLLVGLGGSFTPISPPIHLSFGDQSSASPVQVQEFLPPGEEPPTEPPTTEASERAPTAEITIPALPVITPPLQPPEMTELQVPDTLRDPPPVQRPPEPEPSKPTSPTEPKTKTAPSAAPASQKPTTAAVRAGKPGGTPSGSQPVPFTAAGGGSFPSPSYPSAARSARLEGTVVLLVTVESSGTPSSVEIRTSSGHTVLDNAARDHLRRNWRWPSGESRLFVVPIKFVLK
jgi:protein TonB